MIDKLIDFHGRMYAITVQVEPLLRGDGGGLAELSAARARQGRLIAAHQLFVHREVFEPVLANGSAADAREVRYLKAECIALTETFRHHARRWSVEDVASQWSSYQPAALGLMAQIRSQITAITAIAAPLVKIDRQVREMQPVSFLAMGSR